MQIGARFRVALLALLLAVQIALPACASAGPGFGSGFGFNKHRLPKVSVGVTLQPVTYDTSIGNGVDTNGFANLPLRVGAHRFYVNSSGSDANTCTQAQSAATPKATVASAVSCLVDGEGDQIAIAQGTTYTAGLGNALNTASGFSPTYPLVIQSYDPADPTNEAKMGRATGANRPVIDTAGSDSFITCCQATPQKFFAVRGLKWSPPNTGDQILTFGGSNGLSNHYVLLENNIFSRIEVAIAQDTRDPAAHIVVRGNAFHDMWSATDSSVSTAPAQGLWLGGMGAVVVEDNVFDHTGWKDTASRDDASTVGGTTIYRHSIYMQDTSDGIIRRNIFVDPSTTACSCRGTVDMYENVAIDSPISFISGLGNFYQNIRPNGEYLFVSRNAAFGDADINTANPRGNAFTGGNGKLGSKTRYNLAIRSRNPANGFAFNTQASANIPSNMDFHDNVEFSWSAAGQVATTSGATAGTQAFPTYENNAWSDPASGSNVNISSHATPNAYTASTFYPALGSADKAAYVSAIKEAPELHPARTALALLQAGYAAIAPVAEDVALSNPNLIHGAAYTGYIAGVQDGSTLTASGLPSGITIDGPNRAYTYDGIGAASSGTFSVTETPPTGPPHTTTLAYTIAASPTLNDLTLSSSNFAVGTPATVAVNGTYGALSQLNSWIETSGAPGSMAVDPDARTLTYNGGTLAASGSFSLIEYRKGATNSPHTSTISWTTGTWTPASLTGLQGWWDANQQTEADGTTVATFVDRSGNAHDFGAAATHQPTIRYAAINGKKALQFDGIQDVMSTTNLMNGATAGAWFAVIKLDADPPATGKGSAVINQFGTSGTDSHHPYTDGNIYDGFGTTVRKTVGNPTPSLASVALLVGISSTNDFRFYVNDTSTPIFSTASNTVAFGTQTRLLGTSDSAVQFLSGLVAEVGVMNAVPNSTDLANLKAYVNSKYGTSF